MGVEIVNRPAGAPTASEPAPAAAPADTGGLKAVGPENSAPLPAAEKPATAPDAINDVPLGKAPAAQTPDANGKKGKPEFDKADESSSKHKKKKGLSKINPF
jgi:outer membrane protein assembly factor BamD